MALTGSIASFNLRFITATQLDSHVSGTTSAVCRLSAAWTSGVWLASRLPISSSPPRTMQTLVGIVQKGTGFRSRTIASSGSRATFFFCTQLLTRR